MEEMEKLTYTKLKVKKELYSKDGGTSGYYYY